MDRASRFDLLVLLFGIDQNAVGRGADFAKFKLLFDAIQLLPLQTVPGNFAMPDVLLGLTLVWAARRPPPAGTRRFSTPGRRGLDMVSRSSSSWS